MNLLLLHDDSLTDGAEDEPQKALVHGRQLQHILDTLKLKPGDTLCVGRVNGPIGLATITTLTPNHAELSIQWHAEAPAALPVTLIIALPRPKMLKRIIQTAVTMGVKKLYFINAWKVEKSYWLSPWLTEEKLLENIELGLEQAKDTVLPEIHLKKLFKPFVEDELPTLSADTTKLLAHPDSPEACPIGLNQATTLIIGPEGGFTPYEVGLLQAQGFRNVHLGPRILRVETAVPVLLGRIFT